MGVGYDLHRLQSGRKMVLGGVIVPADKGPIGHSDGDVVLHAIIDSILGAAALGDIGGMFPDTDPAIEGIASLEMLRLAVELIQSRGWEVGNIDVTLILESPKISPFVEAMRDTIAAALGVRPEAVSVKAKTSEGLGEIGRGEAAACHAVALLQATAGRAR